MADLKVLDIITGICAIVFAIYGGRVLTLMDSRSATESNMALFATGMLVLVLNVAAAATSFCPRQNVCLYFGYLVTYTGKALHFILMGFYTYRTMCAGACTHTWGNWLHAFCGEIRRCMEVRTGLDMILVIASLVGVVVGIILLVLRCAGQTPAHQYGVDVGQSLQLDIVGIAAIAASCGLILRGCILFRPIFEGMSGVYWLVRFGLMAELVFIFTAGIFSAWSSVKASATVGQLFGFLYNAIGRGIFYICMGFYLVANNSGSDDKFSTTIGWICGIVAICVGIVYLVLRFFAQNHAAARDTNVELGVRR